MAVDNSGAQVVDIEGQLLTYSGVVAAYTPYATATDMVVLQNPAGTNTMARLTRVSVTGTITAAANVDLYLQWRSAVDTGGTLTAVNNFVHDGRDAASLCTLYNVSVAPTLTGTVRTLRADRIQLLPPATAVAGQALEWAFGTRGGAKCPRIRPTEQIAINFNGAAVGAGTTLFIAFEWTETTPVQ